ncbi:MAG: hypothetical protein IBX58_12440 [Roseovarius sp.]|nr:hypothetical protein [Roseovarius sp.]
MRFEPLSPQEPIARPATRKRRKPAPLAGILRRLGLVPSPDLDSLSKRILLPSLPVSDEEHAREQHFWVGQRLARQDDWEILANDIRRADRLRLRTPAGQTLSNLMAQGARADLVAAARDAIADGRTPDHGGLEALEEARNEYPGSYPITLVVALAHVDMGRLWRDHGRDAGELRFLEHFAQAEALLDAFDATALDAPSIASAQCALLAARPTPRRHVADDYTRLIDLDPGTSAHMRALGEALLPSRFGSLDEIELEARRCAARTDRVWGAGGYAWVWLDALALDPDGLGVVDAPFFVEGLRAIATRLPDQHVINQLTAFCALVMAPHRQGRRLGLAKERARATIHACLDWLVADHLRELHPLLWSQALIGAGRDTTLPPRRTVLQHGRATALRAIAERFADDLADGHALAFSSAGMYRLPSL